MQSKIKSIFKSKKQLLSVIVLLALIIYLILYIINLFVGLHSEESYSPTENNKFEGIEVVDELRSNLPTYNQLEAVMTLAMEDIYNSKIDAFYEKLTNEFISIPNTGVTLPTTYMNDSVYISYLTVTALKRNPYIQQSIIEERDIIRSMPDGLTLSVNKLEQNYSNMEIFISETDSLKALVRGLENGNYFEEEVDLTNMFNEYLLH